ncbi:hypothetical protein TH53_12225 [Pedobacter lusitanus]|uniref:Uncharacterized protein n=2 Tax=Pedobacter lusitanus TaxID=1503925 RepID=A0A0D0FWN2_9SPHI|nr:hypothetical protein TH53_12225 [Pedobacter lusitanus]
MNLEYNVKLIYSNLCNAMIRNVNNNFYSISFDILQNEDIQVKIILYSYNEDEKNLVEDLMAEFSALEEKNNVLAAILTTDFKELKLRYKIYESTNS